MEGKNFEKPIDEEGVINELKKKRDSLYHLPGKKLEVHSKIVDISDKLESKYPNARKTYLFHIMLYSGIDRAKCVDFDFPGEDSVVKRLEALVKEYQAEDK